jgi:transmembrane sensor
MTLEDAASAATRKDRILAEAASWVTRLHGPARDTQLEQGLKRWLAEDPQHLTAFEITSEVWQNTGDLPAALPAPVVLKLQTRERAPRLHWAIAAAMTGSLVVAAVKYWEDPTLSTSVGEQRSVMLDDGTRVLLNTASNLEVDYDERSRTVVLTTGEAFFDVARQPARPFVVMAGSQRIVALGTSFVVRHDREEVSVTLVEGKLAVAPVAVPVDLKRPLPADFKLMKAGQRFQYAKTGTPMVDAPSIAKITAWQRGQLIFDRTPLREAIAEFNRYGKVKIRLDADLIGEIPIGGVFRIGDVLSFTDTVAASHDLSVERKGDEVTLRRSSRRAQP